MGIDKLNLTIFRKLDIPYLEEIGEIQENENRNFFYRYFCSLDKAQLFWKPHKFSTETNYTMPYTKIVTNPKYFNSYSEMHVYLMLLFGEDTYIDLASFNISRFDVKADIEDLPIYVALARTFAMGYRKDSFNLYKGSTFYCGTNPKIKIYDKLKEIKDSLKPSRKRKTKTLDDLTEYEKGILNSGKDVTRFEISIGKSGLTLHDVVFNPESLVKYFDRLVFYDFEDDEHIAKAGGLQFLFSHIPRKKRKFFEEYKSEKLKEMVKQDYLDSIKDWFKPSDYEVIKDEDIPF